MTTTEGFMKQSNYYLFFLSKYNWSSYNIVCVNAFFLSNALFGVEDTSFPVISQTLIT